MSPPREFSVGDPAEYSFSMGISYSGDITQITARTVTIKTYSSSRPSARLSLYEFCWRNHNWDYIEAEKKNKINLMHL
jgi:small-conductance mechanosensitive channel